MTASHIPWPFKPIRQNSDLRRYARLFPEANVKAEGKNFLQSLNPDSLKVVTAYAEPSLDQAQPDQKLQFERLGNFVADLVDHKGDKPVFNRVQVRLTNS
ncbi:hypothetical protein ACHEXL_03890 [Limnohabitans sp. yimb22184]